MLHATRTMRRHGGDAVQETYARGGGRSGAVPDESGMRTVSAMALVDEALEAASPPACGAPSAVTHGIPVTHVPGEGLEHGA